MAGAGKVNKGGGGKVNKGGGGKVTSLFIPQLNPLSHCHTPTPNFELYTLHNCTFNYHLHFSTPAFILLSPPDWFSLAKLHRGSSFQITLYVRVCTHLKVLVCFLAMVGGVFL